MLTALITLTGIGIIIFCAVYFAYASVDAGASEAAQTYHNTIARRWLVVWVIDIALFAVSIIIKLNYYGG